MPKITNRRFDEIMAAVRAGKRPIGVGGMGIYDGRPIEYGDGYWLWDSESYIQLANYGGLKLEATE